MSAPGTEGASTQVQSDEDQMEVALQELRAERASGAADSGAATTAATTEGSSAEAAAAAPAPKATEGAEATAAPAAAAPADGKDAKQATDKDGKPAAAPAAEKSTEQQLADANAELHRMRSEIGRVSALNRKSQELERTVQDLRQQLDAAKQPPKTEEEARNQLTALAESLEQFPELQRVVQTVGAALKEVQGQVQSTAKQAAQEVVRPLQPLAERHQDQVQKEAEAAEAAADKTFRETYPEARDVIVTPDFKQWLPTASRAVQIAFYKGQSAADATAVMDAYDAHLRRIGKPSIAVAPQTTQQPAAEAAKTTEAKPGDDRLRRAAGIPSRQTNGSKGALPPEDDFEGSLEFFRQKRLEKARAAA
jgi:gas vesicle protein